MSSLSSRARWGLAVVVAFLGGLILASGGLNLSRLGFAQSKPSLATTAPIAEASNAFVAIADHVTPAVVSISAESRPAQSSQRRRALPNGITIPPGMEDFFDQFGQQVPQVEGGSGSGFIVSKDGYILTNNHVVTTSDRTTVADQVTVQLLDHRTFKAKVIGNDPTTDIAVIKINGDDFPTLPLGNDNNTRVGEWVLAIGNPLGFDFTVTAGIISAKHRSLPGLLNRRTGPNYSISDLIQTDAAINPGNSGGPLVNARGEAIGITSAIASPTGVNAGYGFAIPITLAKKVMDDIIAHGKVRVAILGIQINEVTPEDAAVAGMKEIRGAKVEGFGSAATSAAQQAGLQAGDVIITADGQAVDRVSTLQQIVRNHRPGETIDVEVMRYGQKKSFRVKLSELEDSPRTAQVAPVSPTSNPTSSSNSELGITVEPVSNEIATQAKLPTNERGVVVTDVVPLGPSYQKLGRNDVIFELLYPGPRRPIRTTADLSQVLQRVRQGDYISLNVATLGQDNSSRVVNIRIGGQ
ncbi:MAG: trypsin-like peptidase domain-containing protein [Gemmatimonadaceae bacterium]